MLLANLSLESTFLRASRVLRNTGADLFFRAAGLVNGSRGVIVDFVPSNEVPAADPGSIGGSMSGGGKGKGPQSKRGGGGGGFGGEDWREMAANSFMDHQSEEFYPVVFFAVGVTSEFRRSLLSFDRNLC